MNDENVPSDASIILALCAVGLCVMTLMVIGAYDVGTYVVHHIQAVVAGL